MLDDLRKSASEGFEEFDDEAESAFDRFDDDDFYEEPDEPKRGFLGMTAAQRFVLALMLFFMSCVLGGFCLILTEKVALPFF